MIELVATVIVTVWVIIGTLALLALVLGLLGLAFGRKPSEPEPDPRYHPDVYWKDLV